MTHRERQEEYELQSLSPLATKSKESRGRAHTSNKCPIRTEFQKDRDRITHSKAFRRLMHKTQVFISPEGDHYRTRLTHTLEVAQIARTIARALKLNEDLTEACALGHDLGHTPFGHTGEDALNRLLPGGFRHNEQSVRVVSIIEHSGNGLNLSYEVIDGILNHRTVCTPATAEGKVVQISDKIAYMNHDVDDAIRAKILTPGDLPSYARDILGATPQLRIDFLVKNMIESSVSTIQLSPDITKIMASLKTFLSKNVYSNQLVKERCKISRMIELLYEYYLNNPHKLPGEFIMRENTSMPQAVADYIAGMTDRFAMKQFEEVYMPSVWQG